MMALAQLFVTLVVVGILVARVGRFEEGQLPVLKTGFARSRMERSAFPPAVIAMAGPLRQVRRPKLTTPCRVQNPHIGSPHAERSFPPTHHPPRAYVGGQGGLGPPRRPMMGRWRGWPRRGGMWWNRPTDSP